MLSALLSSFVGESSGAAGILFADMGAGERSSAAGILFADMGAERQRKPRTRCRRTCRTELQTYSKIHHIITYMHTFHLESYR